MAKRKTKHKPNKARESDFSAAFLPCNRRSQFFDCLRNRWGLFLEIGAFFGLASLLFVLLLYWQDIAIHNISIDNSLDEATKTAQLGSMKLTFSSLFSLLFALAFLPLGGVMRVFRSLVYDEGVFLWHDFKKGFKGTWKTSLLLGVLLGGGYFACSFYSLLISPSWLAFAPYGVLLFLVLPWALTTLSYASVYSSKVSITLQNGFVITVKSYFKALLFVLSFCLPLLFLLLPNGLLRSLALIVCFLLFYPVALFGFYLMDISYFDSLINSELQNGLYHKGLYDGQMEEGE